MESPSVLLVELDAERRTSLGFGLTAEGYEVVPAVDAEEGLRFAEGLRPTVIVAPVSLAGGEFSALVAGPHGGSTLLFLGESDADREDLPSGALFVSTEGLDSAQLVRRIRLALVGQQVGVEPDHRLRALVGDLSLTPLLDVCRRLREIGATGRIECDDGACYFRQGELIAAQCGLIRGQKAFCRLSRRIDGPFRIVLTEERMPAREILDEFDALVSLAIEDAVGEIPDGRVRFEVELGPGLFSEPFSALQQQILAEVREGARVDRLLNAIPLPDSRVAREIAVLERRGVLTRREAAPAVAVITDSTADLPDALIGAHGIGMVPLTVIFGDREFVDRVELEPGRFYDLLEERNARPTTRPPVPEKFAFEFHRRLLRQDVVAVLISEKLSQTVVHARQAADQPAMSEVVRPSGEAPRIEIVDSGQVSLPLGLLALFAARMAERDLGAAEIAVRLEEISARIVTLFVVDTLEYLARGGRIGKARAWLGRLMGIRPILGVQNGEVVGVDRVRGRSGTLLRLIQLAREHFDPEQALIGGVAHARAPANADRLRELLVETFAFQELYVTEMGPVVGTHVGPGCVGATLFQPTPEEAVLLAPRAGGSTGLRSGPTSSDDREG